MQNFLVLLFVLLGFGCATDTSASLRVYVLDTGQMRVKDLELVSPGHPPTDAPVTLGDASFLVVHPRGTTALWDTGLPDTIATFPGGQDGEFATIFLSRMLRDQLADIGYRPADIDYVIPSHLHFDHAGNLNYFTESEILLQPAEYDAAFGDRPSEYLIDPDLFARIPRANFRIVEDQHDVFGDGTMVLYRKPGHSPGHQTAVGQLADGPVMFSGDLYHSQYNRTNRLNPVFGYNHKRNLRTMERIEGQLEALGATLWMQHDPVFNDTVRFAPAYYQ